MKKFLLTKKGMSLVEMLIGIAIIAGTGSIIVKSGLFVQNSKKVLEQKGELREMEDGLLSALKSLVFDTKSIDGTLRNEGLCHWVSIDPGAVPPVAPIYGNLNDTSKVLSAERWKKYLPNWEKSLSPDCGEVDDKWSFCFTIAADALGLPPTIQKSNPLMIVDIVPINMNPVNGPIYSRLSEEILNSRMDIKNIGFDFKLKILTSTTDKNGIKKIKGERERSTFEWIGLGGYCDKDGKKLSFTGMEFVVGDNVIFNRNGFDTHDVNPIDPTFKKIVAQQGQYLQNAQYVTTDAEKNIVTSCNETKYRCPNRNSSDREYQNLTVVADLEYISPNRYAAAGGLMTEINYSIEKNDIKLLSNIDTFIGYGTDCTLPFGSKAVPVELKAGCIKSDKITEEIMSQKELSVSLHDFGKEHSANNLCSQICEKSTGYNSSGVSFSQNYSGYLEFLYTDFEKKQRHNVSEGIGCTACYMKSCDQFGLGTFGPMNVMPSQPLDSSIPECSFWEDINSIHDDLVFEKFPIKDQPLKENNCISASLSANQNELELSDTNCNQTLPVLCYAFGKYFLAKDVQNGTPSLSKRSYEDAAKRCFEMGREVINSQTLDAYLSNVSTEGLSRAGSNYDFYNLAAQGSFIAPQSSNEISEFKTWLIEENLTTESFWIALIRDQDKVVTTRAPFIADFVDGKNSAIYYDGAGKLIHTVLNYPFIPKLETGNQSDADHGAILLHNLKYKGLKIAKSSSPMDEKKFKFVCRKNSFPYQIFISSAGSKKQKDGKQFCNDDGGRFLPPLNTHEYVKAMMELEAIDSKYSFPDPSGISSVDSFKAAWVAISVTKDEAKRGEWRPYAEQDNDLKTYSFSSADYNIEEYNIPPPDSFDLIASDTGNLVNPRANIMSDKKLKNKIKLKVGGKFKIKANGKKYEVELYSLPRPEEEEEDKEIELTPEDIMTNFNINIKPAARTIMRIITNNSTKKFVLERRIIGDSQTIEILDDDDDDDINDKLEFDLIDTVVKGPEIRVICLKKATDRFETELYKTTGGGNCPEGYGRNLNKDDLKSSKIYQTLWSLHGGTSSTNFKIDQ